MIVALWILTALVLVLWSLFAWGVHSLLTIDPARLDDLNAVAERMPYGEWIERWFPGWREVLALMVDLSQTALGWVGSVAPWAVWTLWGVGALVMVVVAALLALAIKSATKLPMKSSAPSAG